MRIGAGFFAGAIILADLAAAGSEPPRLEFDGAVLGRIRVNPKPRPYDGRVDITPDTSLYFEVLVPDANGPAGMIDPDSVTATLVPEEGDPVVMLRPGQEFSPGFTGQVFRDVDVGTRGGTAVYVLPDQPLEFDTRYRVEVRAQTIDDVAIDPARDSWSFTTRAAIRDPTVSWSVDLTAPLVHWHGWFFSGLLKLNFDTSRLFDQRESYELMKEIRAINPDAFSLQRDWPLTGDFWMNGVFDGNPNLVRERETRRIVDIANEGGQSILTVTDIEEGPLYGIAQDRPLSADFRPGDVVTVGDREKFETTVIEQVRDASGRVAVRRLSTSGFILDYPGSHPEDEPDTPDNFTLPLCYLRKLAPPGTPVYYWSRLDHEWDLVHREYGRALEVNFSSTPVDLARDPVPQHPGGNGSIGPPKDDLEWHHFVYAVAAHVIDRYGEATLDFQWTVGNEPNLRAFWSGTKNDFYRLYDVTVNAVLLAFEERGYDPYAVRVGGVEVAGLGGRGWLRDALYHMSGRVSRPAGGIEETNAVCNDARFEGLVSTRVNAICSTWGGRGAPIDLVSIHEYDHAARAAADITGVRDDALKIDPEFFHDLSVDSHEATPDWMPRTDPAARNIYLGNGFAPSWAADWMARLVERAESDPRYGRHDADLTVWPFDYNARGISSFTGLMRTDDDGDGVEDRITTIRKDLMNHAELLAHMGRQLDALEARDLEGVRVGAVRSRTDRAHVFLVYSHDEFDTDSRDETVLSARLSIAGIEWPMTTVRLWRIDRDHSSPYRAYAALPRKSLYRTYELEELVATDDLVEAAAARHHDTSGGTLDLTVPLAVNGVSLVELTERLEVGIDIRPWSARDRIVPFSHGIVPVAILGSASFDVADVDVSTLAFGPDHAAPRSERSHRGDVDHDGWIDLVTFYGIHESGIAIGDTEACVTGETVDGTALVGCAAIRTGPARDPRRGDHPDRVGS